MFHLISPTLQHWASGISPQTFSIGTHSHKILSSLMAFKHFYTERPKMISPGSTSPLLKIPTWMFKSHLKLTMSKSNSTPPFQKNETFSSLIFSTSVNNTTPSFQLPRPQPGSRPWLLSLSQHPLILSSATYQLYFKTSSRGWPHGWVVKFTSSASAAQGFTGSDPGQGHGTAHQAMLRQHPTCHN